MTIFLLKVVMDFLRVKFYHLIINIIFNIIHIYFNIIERYNKNQKGGDGYDKYYLPSLAQRA